MRLFFTIIILASVVACHKKDEVREDFQQYYDEYEVSGSFVLYNLNEDYYVFYNQEQFNTPYTPASTFKICNSLIGVETGVIPDENYIIPWDSVKRNPVWDKDHDLKTAYQNSTVWYYQELARRVGGEQMKAWLDKAEYGNRDTSGGIDLFWLTGGLRITPKQQIDFLRKLQANELPFSQRTIDIVKPIMVQRDTLNYVVRAKTGWGFQNEKEIGWYVGYVEANHNVYFFATLTQMDSKHIENPEKANKFNDSRKAITYSILKDLKVIPH
jgi:beta-lactamase class D